MRLALGTLVPMTAKRLGIITVIALLAAALIAAAWLTLRAVPESPGIVQPQPEPVREQFHASKPLRLQVSAASEEDQLTAQVQWLRHELNHLLNRGRMRVIAESPSELATRGTFVLSVTLDATQAQLQLLAPDERSERQETLPLPDPAPLAIIQAFAQALPPFLDAAHSVEDWRTLIGTDDAAAYQAYLTGAMEWSGPDSVGLTHPPAVAGGRSRALERLETLLRAQPDFARGWGVLAKGYLSLGGEDEQSLIKLAQDSAERAAALDEDLADAHAALGLVHLKRNEWVSAHERLRQSLTLDVNNATALEGLGCLLVDAGHYRAAAPLALRATHLQPLNIGAHECLAFSRLHADEESAALVSAPAAQVHALQAILDDEMATARELLQESLSAQQFQRWAIPLLEAAADSRRIPRALQAVTAAASERRIDAATEILCGVALRQPEFVFNRISRLRRQGQGIPLRVLWMPQTQFLREHPRFETVIGESGLATFWQEYGVADVCATEPQRYGCNSARRP